MNQKYYEALKLRFEARMKEAEANLDIYLSTKTKSKKIKTVLFHHLQTIHLLFSILWLFLTCDCQ